MLLLCAHLDSVNARTMAVNYLGTSDGDASVDCDALRDELLAKLPSSVLDEKFDKYDTAREKLTGIDRWGDTEHFAWRDGVVQLLDSYLEHPAWHKRGSRQQAVAESAEDLAGSFMTRSISKASTRSQTVSGVDAL